MASLSTDWSGLPHFNTRRKERKDLNPTEAANRDWADIDLWDLYTSAWHLPLVRARTGRFSANLEFESLFTRGPSRITFGARNVEFYSQLILPNPYEVRLATSLSGDKEFHKRKPEWNGIFPHFKDWGLVRNASRQAQDGTLAPMEWD